MYTHPYLHMNQVVCGASHTFFIMKTGDLRGCGRNDFGQLGLGTTQNEPSTCFFGVKTTNNKTSMPAC